MGLFHGGSGLSGGTEICPDVPEPQIATQPIFSDWTVQHLFNVLSGAFMGGAILISLSLYMLHATHFSNPLEQVKILRIIFFVPVLSLVSFGMIYLQDRAIYLQPWGVAYEAFALASYFMLVNVFISPDRYSEADFFKSLKLKNGKVAGARWFTRARLLVFQYWPVALLIAAITDITSAAGVYCQTTNSVHFAKLWLTIVKAISVALAALSAIKFTLATRSSIPERRIMSKLIALKIVIFLETIQTLIFSFVKGNVTPTQTLGYYDLTVGIPSLLLCIELFLISIVLHFTYNWRPYALSSRSARSEYHGVFYAISSAANPAEIVKEFAYGFGLSSPPQFHPIYTSDAQTPLQPYEQIPPKPQSQHYYTQY